MATLSKKSFTNLAAKYGKRVQNSNEKELASGTVSTSILKGYRPYNGDGYSTLFVDLDEFSIAIDSKVELPEKIDIFDITIVSGTYKGEPYVKMRVVNVR